MDPTENGSGEAALYTSRYPFGVDEKRRVQLPAKWRPSQPDVEFTMVLWSKTAQGPCLRVLPPKKMAELVRELAAMPNGDPNKGILKRIIGSESVQITLDKAGRFVLPEEMAKEAGIDGEVVFVGLLDAFEIWSPERWKKLKAADEVMKQEAFKLME